MTISRQPSVFATAFRIIGAAGLHLHRPEISQVELEYGCNHGSQNFGRRRGILDKGDAGTSSRASIGSPGLFMHGETNQISGNCNPVKGPSTKFTRSVTSSLPTGIPGQ